MNKISLTCGLGKGARFLITPFYTQISSKIESTFLYKMFSYVIDPEFSYYI